MCSIQAPLRRITVATHILKFVMTLSNIFSGILLISVRLMFLSTSIVWGLLAQTLSFRYPHRKYSKGDRSGECVGQGWSVRQEVSLSPGGGMRGKHWTNAMLLHPADKSHRLCPLIASVSLLGWIFFSLVRLYQYRLVFTVTGRPSAFSNQYSLIMPLCNNV